jgi:hypothetical protein
VGSHLWQLTWRERVALRWALRSLALLDTRDTPRRWTMPCAAKDYTLDMAGVVSGVALVGAFGAVTGVCAILAARLYRAGSPGQPRQPGDS